MVATALAVKIFYPIRSTKNITFSRCFVNNFTNQLYRISHELTDNKNINFDILKPLIAETSKKFKNYLHINHRLDQQNEEIKKLSNNTVNYWKTIQHIKKYTNF